MKKPFSPLLLLFIPLIAVGQQSTTVLQLPPPHTDGGKPLMNVLENRKSTREFSPDSIPIQTLSDLLWAAFGVNRQKEEKRTAPSARNYQEIDIYCATARGTYKYNAGKNQLEFVTDADLREHTGMQPFVRTAPLTLVYVADRSKMKGASEEDMTLYSGVDAGCIVENAYLFCASEGLAVVVRAMIPRKELAPLLKLRPEQRIIVAQTIGYPKK